MARKGRRSRRRYSRRYFRRHRRGTLGSKFMRFFNKPVGHIIAPATGAAGISSLFFTPAGDGHSLFNWITTTIQDGGNQNSGDPSYYIGQGLLNAAPWLFGAALAGIVGRKFHI